MVEGCGVLESACLFSLLTEILPKICNFIVRASTSLLLVVYLQKSIHIKNGEHLKRMDVDQKEYTS